MICPNCGDKDARLYTALIGETEITHCGCFYEEDPENVKFNFHEVVLIERDREEVNNENCIL